MLRARILSKYVNIMNPKHPFSINMAKHQNFSQHMPRPNRILFVWFSMLLRLDRGPIFLSHLNIYKMSVRKPFLKGSKKGHASSVEAGMPIGAKTQAHWSVIDRK
jgi:hypothetical protein